MIKQFFIILRHNRSWLILATLFFVSGAAIMYAGLNQDPGLLTLLEEFSLGVLEELGEQVFGGHPLQGAAILFFHNLRATLQVIIFGLLLGFVPLLSAFANGAIISAVAFSIAQEGIAPLPFLLAGILPHGILELPAFLISVAFGLKLGYHVVFPLPGQKRIESLGSIFREIGTALPVLVVLLLLAALIEVFITPMVLLLFFTA